MESYSWLRRCMVQSLWEDILDSLQNLAHALTTQHSNCTPYYRVFPWNVYTYIFDSLIDVLLYFSDLAHWKSKLLKVCTHFGDTLYVCKRVKSICPHKPCPWCYSSFICYCQYLEATNSPSVGEWINVLWYIYTMEYYSVIINELSSYEMEEP